MKNGLYERRIGVSERLEAQLKKGTKQEKVNGKSTSKMIFLGENDVKRIKKELGSLKESLKGESI